MALDFPANTSLPYVDPVSGLKYVFNDAVGGWEAAIQPPAIISPSVPSIAIPGFLWWDSDGGSLYVYYQDSNSAQWVEAIPTSGGAGSIVNYGLNPPSEPSNGQLWWSTDEGNLYIYYQDGDSQQWIQTNTYGSSGGELPPGPSVTSSATAPETSKANDLWYNTTDSTLYINYKTGDVANWVKSHNITQTTPVTSVTGTTPVVVTSGTTPVVSVNSATTITTGVVTLASVTDSNNKSDGHVLTPKVLADSILTYIPTASSSTKGLMQFATEAEATTGSIGNRAISPLTLKKSINALSNIPVGAILEYGGSTSPSGYLKCDGTDVSRSTYAELFSSIGTTYGIGDGVLTFGLPNIPGTYMSIIKL